MRHDDQVRLIKQLGAHLDAGTSCDAGGVRMLPTSDYIDPALAEREWNEFFRKVPQCIGMSGDLPVAGSFLTNKDLGVPILATRDTGGALVGLPKTDHFGEVDKACLGLVELPSEERHGLLFVHPDPDAEIDLDHLLGAWFNDEFPSWGFGDLEPLPLLNKTALFATPAAQ